MSKTQKILLILIILVVLIAGGFALYYIFFKKAPVVIKGPGQQQGQVSAPQKNIEIVDSKLKKISAAPSVSPIATTDGKRVLYMEKTGGIFEADFDGANAKEIKGTLLPNLIKILWSADRNEFTAAYESPEGRILRYYNVATKKTALYDANIKWIAFSKTENKIAYHLTDELGGRNAVIVADPDGSRAKTALNTRLKDARLAWVGDKKIAVSTAPSGLAQNLLWMLNTDTGKIISILTNVNGLTSKWSATGDRFIFSQTAGDGKNLVLSASNENGTIIRKLDIQTLPEKCVFTQDEKNIVCAVPTTTPDIMWPDDYYKKLYDAREQIWKIDLSGGKKDLLYEFPENMKFDATDLVLSPDESALVFFNRKDEYVYGLKLR